MAYCFSISSCLAASARASASRGIGDVLVNLDQPAVVHGMAADRDDISVAELVDGIDRLAGSGLAQAVGDIFRGVRRTAGRRHAAVENVAQPRPGPGLRPIKSVHLGEVAIADDDPEVGIENAQTVGRAFDRGVEQNLRPRRSRAADRPAQAGRPPISQVSVRSLHHKFFLMKRISP